MYILNISAILIHSHKYNEAITYIDKALDLDKNNVNGWVNKGKVLYQLGEKKEAEICFNKALKISPNNTESLNNIAVILSERGDIETAISYYDKALMINPNDSCLHSSKIMLKHYSDHYTESQRFSDHMAFGKSCSNSKIGTYWESFNINRQPDKFRIGFVSGDFREHPVGYFLQSILPELAKKAQLIAYHTQPNIDEFTNSLRIHCIEWRQVSGLDDLNLAQLIRRDKIDILIDLSGHTLHHRLSMFSYRPAPLQATWMGYFATTGIAEIDFVIGDSIVLQSDNKEYFIEKPALMPNSYLCFSPPNFESQINLEEKLSKATFGCFNNLMKISDSVLAVWAEILKSNTEASILIKSMRLDRDDVREPILKRLFERGVRPEQLIIEGGGSRKEILSSYNRVQLSLDTFPYPGGTTTAEALWMGVPVLHKAGNSFVGRVGESILRAVGLPEWVVPNEDEYIHRAIQVANGNYTLPKRQSLREQMRDSSFMDAPRFASDFIALIEQCFLDKYSKINKEEK